MPRFTNGHVNNKDTTPHIGAANKVSIKSDKNEILDPKYFPLELATPFKICVRLPKSISTVTRKKRKTRPEVFTSFSKFLKALKISAVQRKPVN